jgi:hypothetical protein
MAGLFWLSEAYWRGDRALHAVQLRWTPSIGFPALCVGSCCEEHAPVQEVETGAAIHLALEQLEPGDVALALGVLQGVESAACTAVSFCRAVAKFIMARRPMHWRP